MSLKGYNPNGNEPVFTFDLGCVEDKLQANIDKLSSQIQAGGGGSVDWPAITNKPNTFTPPIASASTLGGVKQGTGVTIDVNGVISANGSSTPGNPNVVYVEDFTGTATAKIQAAIDFAAANAKKTVILADKDYYTTGTITVKTGVRLQGGYGSSITIGANVQGFIIQKSASIWDLKINVDFTGYSKEVIYLDGVNKFYNSSARARFQNLVIYNWTGTVSGTAIYMYSGGTSHEVSFVNFDDVKIVSFSKGIYMKAVQPASGNAWLNANRFHNVTMEDCIDFITLEGSETIPNECSGNIFSNLQIQPSANTINIAKVQGQYNKFEGMTWDLQEILHSNPVFTFLAASNYNEVDMKSIATRTTNLGKTSNKIAVF